MKCFKCNGEGHMARDCPVAAAAATAKLLEQQKKQWEQMQQQQQQAREQSQGNAPKVCYRVPCARACTCAGERGAGERLRGRRARRAFLLSG